MRVGPWKYSSSPSISSFGVKRLWLTHASIRVPSTEKYSPDKNVRSNCSGGIDERPVVDYNMQKSRGRSRHTSHTSAHMIWSRGHAETRCHDENDKNPGT